MPEVGLPTCISLSFHPSSIGNARVTTVPDTPATDLKIKIMPAVALSGAFEGSGRLARWVRLCRLHVSAVPGGDCEQYRAGVESARAANDLLPITTGVL